MAIEGYMIFTDDDMLYDGCVYQNRIIARDVLNEYLATCPLLRVVKVEIHPSDEVIRFHEG